MSDMTITNWGRAGVMWTGQPGDEIECIDDMSDYGLDAPLFDGDMEAALFVARNSAYPWIVYVQTSDRWTVEVHETQDVAQAEVEGAAYDDAEIITAFFFDGRTQLPQDGTDGVGYLPPASS